MPAPRSLVLAIPIALVALLFGAALARGVMAPAPSAAAEAIERDVRRLAAQVSALERKIDALEREKAPELSSAILPRRIEAPPSAPTSEPAPAPSPAAAPAELRDLVRQVIEERDRQTEQQRDERRREWEAQRVVGLSDQLGLAESAKAPFRAILLDYQAKAREAFRKFATEDPAAVQQELRKLREDRDVKLSPYLSPDQIRRLDDLDARRAAPR